MKQPVVLLCAVLLAACAGEPVRNPGQMAVQQDIWQQRKALLNNIEGWHVKGRVAVNNGSEFWAINLDWQQDKDTYIIYLNGPFGTGSVKLAGSRHGVILTDGDRNTFYANNPDTLLYEQTGVLMPVSHLRYWILGLPEPGQAQQQQLDNAGRLGSLQRDSWQIRFKRYVQVNNVQVPDKIFISRGEDLNVRMIIADWQLTTAQVAKNP